MSAGATSTATVHLRNDGSVRMLQRDTIKRGAYTGKSFKEKAMSLLMGGIVRSTINQKQYIALDPPSK